MNARLVLGCSLARTVETLWPGRACSSWTEGLVGASDEVRLTEEGRHLAAVVVRRHRLAERFLSEVLKLPWAKAHEEAEVWETMISDDVEKAMWAAMEDPKTCPHGNPIPGAGYQPPRMKPIADMERGETLALERISEELELDAEMMRFLDENHIRPDSWIHLVQKDPYGGITVEVRDRQVGISVFASERLVRSYRLASGLPAERYGMFRRIGGVPLLRPRSLTYRCGFAFHQRALRGT